jgi:hypothetical protein
VLDEAAGIERHAAGAGSRCARAASSSSWSTAAAATARPRWPRPGRPVLAAPARPRAADERRRRRRARARCCCSCTPTRGCRPRPIALVLRRRARGARWGRFDVHIDGRSALLPVVAALMNLRSRLTGIATGDQAIFVRARLRARRRLPRPAADGRHRALAPPARLGRPACLRARVVTSGRRWEQRGVWRTIVLMWRLRWRYWRGESPQAGARPTDEHRDRDRVRQGARAGLAKTRLAPALGAEGAAALARHPHEVFATLPPAHGLALTAQGDGDLGARMHRALTCATWDHERAADRHRCIPAIDADMLRSAAAALADTTPSSCRHSTAATRWSACAALRRAVRRHDLEHAHGDGRHPRAPARRRPALGRTAAVPTSTKPADLMHLPRLAAVWLSVTPQGRTPDEPCPPRAAGRSVATLSTPAAAQGTPLKFGVGMFQPDRSERRHLPPAGAAPGAAPGPPGGAAHGRQLGGPGQVAGQRRDRHRADGPLGLRAGQPLPPARRRCRPSCTTASPSTSR